MYAGSMKDRITPGQAHPPARAGRGRQARSRRRRARARARRRRELRRDPGCRRATCRLSRAGRRGALFGVVEHLGAHRPHRAGHRRGVLARARLVPPHRGPVCRAPRLGSPRDDAAPVGGVHRHRRAHGLQPAAARLPPPHDRAPRRRGRSSPSAASSPRCSPTAPRTSPPGSSPCRRSGRPGCVVGAAVLHGRLGGLVVAALVVGRRRRRGAVAQRRRRGTTSSCSSCSAGSSGSPSTSPAGGCTATSRCVAERERLRERERLARVVHDGVLQTLAFIHRRGDEIGGPGAELGALAADQERTLRRLVSQDVVGPRLAASVAGEIRRDLRLLLGAHEGERVSVSLPGGPVPLEQDRAQELDAAVTAALDNVTRHAGDDARAWLLLEDHGDTVTVTVRDNGVGVEPAHLLSAADARPPRREPVDRRARARPRRDRRRHHPTRRRLPGRHHRAPRGDRMTATPPTPRPRGATSPDDGARRRRPPALARRPRARPRPGRARCRRDRRRRAVDGAPRAGHAARRPRPRPQPARAARRRGVPGPRRPRDPGPHPLGQR